MRVPDALASVVRTLELGELRAVDGFGEHSYWAVHVSGLRALRVWRLLRDALDETGFWPLIVGAYGGPDSGGPDATIDQFVEGAQSIREMPDEQLEFSRLKRTPTESLAAAREISFEEWVVRQGDPGFQVQENLRKAQYFDGIKGASSMAELYRTYAEDWGIRPKWEFNPDDYALPPKENRTPPQHELHCLKYFDSNERRELVTESVAILYIPTRYSWEVPAYLYYSTMELGRPPQVHVAALKWLNDHYGAELVGIEDRVLEVIPRTRPSTPAEALRAAVAIHAYSNCPVTSENELASTSELAVYLMQSEYWSFCWP